MFHRYIERTLEPVLKRASQEFPVVVLTGPRQSGKTTLLKYLFHQTHRYVSLELPDVRMAAMADPRGFLAMYAPPVVFDEIQYAPDLLHYIKENVDAHRSDPGQYLLTGSQHLLLMERVTESLAGRAAMLRLLPLSYREMRGDPQAPFPWERERSRQPCRGPLFLDLWRTFLQGGYPELAAMPNRDIGLWHSSYVQTYLERDVRSLRQIGDLMLFQGFLRALAARNGQLLNLTELSRDLGMAVNTARAWLSVLEATFQVTVLRPYFVNVGKRLVKTPKVYFTDVGTLCHLSGLKDVEHAASGPMAGAVFEAAVLSEIMKGFLHRGREPHVYFWRTSSGVEVDFIVETGDAWIPVEVKVSATPRPSMAAAIKTFQEVLGKRAGAGYLVHPGDVSLPLAPDVVSLPFAEL